MQRAGAFDGAGQFFELGGERLQLGGEEAALILRNGIRRFEQGFQHHRDARKNGFLDAFECLFEACLLLRDHDVSDLDENS